MIAANLNGTKKLMELAGEVDADGVLVAPPYYFSMPEEDVGDFYEQIADFSENLPIIAYQIPQCTSPVTLKVFERLLKMDAVRGIKNSSGSCLEMMHELALRDRYRKNFAILTGSDESIYGMIHSGADGSFTALAYLFPDMVSELYKHLEDSKGMEIQMQFVELAGLANKMPFPLGYKILGEATGRMKFGPYLQAVSEGRMNNYRKIQDEMKRVIETMG